MKKINVTIEYDECMRQKAVKQKVKRPGGRHVMDRVMVPVKDPKCWEVITVENTVKLTPGQRLTERQMKAFMKLSSYNITVGLPGQFRVSNSRY